LSLSTVKEGKAKREKILSPKSPKLNKELFCVKALYDYPGYEEGELSLSAGQIVKVFDNTTFHDWWKGEINGKVGIFPSNYVQLIQEMPSSETRPIPLPETDQSDEGFVMANAERLDKFEQIAANFDSRSSVTENAGLQENYSKILAMRPRILKLLHNIHTKSGNFSVFYK
jgi:signal transducing adaptor molecule